MNKMKFISNFKILTHLAPILLSQLFFFSNFQWYSFSLFFGPQLDFFPTPIYAIVRLRNKGTTESILEIVGRFVRMFSESIVLV